MRLQVSLCTLASSDNRVLAERALEFDLKPVIDALAVELVRAVECLDHLTGLQHIYANCTIVRFGGLLARWVLWLLVFESSIGVDDCADLLRRKLLFLFFLLELLGKVRRRVVRVETSFFSLRITFSVIGCLLESMLLRCAGIKGVSIEIHLDVLRVHITHHLRQVGKYAIQIWHVLHVEVNICTVGNPLMSLELISSEIELECLLLLSVPSLYP